jgi:hypothetical protein
MNDLRRFLRAEWDRVAGYGCLAAGVVLLGAGVVGVRTSADVIDEISYLVTGGIGSIFLLGVGATLLLSADLHDDFRKLHRVEQKLDRVERLLLAQHPELLEDSDVRSDAGTLAVRRGRLSAGVGISVAAVLFGAGALRTADQPSTDHIAGSVGVALGGALLVALVAAVMVAQLRVSVEQRKLAVLGNWLGVSATGRADVAFTAVDAGPARPVAAGAVFVVSGLPFYHRAGCQLLADRPVTALDRVALPTGTSPCRLCEPA